MAFFDLLFFTLLIQKTNTGNIPERTSERLSLKGSTTLQTVAVAHVVQVHSTCSTACVTAHVAHCSTSTRYSISTRSSTCFTSSTSNKCSTSSTSRAICIMQRCTAGAFLRASSCKTCDRDQWVGGGNRSSGM